MGMIKYQPGKAMIQNGFFGTYVVLPGPRTIGVCGTYVVP